MASISSEANSRRTIQFVGIDGKRRSSRLGKMTLRNAEGFRTKVEALLAAKVGGHSPEPEISRWLATLPATQHERLAKIGLA